MNIKELTNEHLFNITNIATGGYFNSEMSSDKQEIETGGYGDAADWVDCRNTYTVPESHAPELQESLNYK